MFPTQDARERGLGGGGIQKLSNPKETLEPSFERHPRELVAPLGQERSY